MQPRPTSHSAALGPTHVHSLAHPTPEAQQQAGQHRPQAPSCGAEAFAVDPAGLQAAGGNRQHTQ